MNLKPLGNRVLAKALEAEEKTSGGILLPDSAKEKSQQAKVIAVGPGKSDKEGNKVPVEVKEGDTIIHSKYSGTDIKIDGVEYKILTEQDILAVVE